MSILSKNNGTDLYLASASPRRQELLHQIGVNFSVITVAVDERPEQAESPECYALRLSREKAKAGLDALKGGNIPVMGADTIVVANDSILGKPMDKQHALDILMSLSAKQHQVLSAVTVMDKDQIKSCLSTSLVSFKELSYEQCEAYWQTGEPCDKAGAYGIQGYAAVFVKEIIGSYSGVVGLPLHETSKLLELFGVPIWQVDYE